MYRQYPFSEQKQWEAKVKVKETDPACSQILFFPVTPSCHLHKGMECASSDPDVYVVRDVLWKAFSVSPFSKGCWPCLLSGVRLPGFEYWLCHWPAV